MKSVIEQLTDEQRESFYSLKNSEGWLVVQKLAADILEDECDLDSVKDELPAEEFKIETLARRKAKEMFTRVFDDVKGLSTYLYKKKIDYS